MPLIKFQNRTTISSENYSIISGELLNGRNLSFAYSEDPPVIIVVELPNIKAFFGRSNRKGLSYSLVGLVGENAHSSF